MGKRHARHKFATEAERRHFVTRRDVLNLSRKVNHLSRVRHENDAQSVEQIVEELKQESYNPILCYKWQGCCRDGASREKNAVTGDKKRAKRQSRKIDAVCVSRMYATRHRSGVVSVKYVSSHTNHDLSLTQAKFLPLPKDVKDGIAIKLSLGIPIDRILDGTVMEIIRFH